MAPFFETAALALRATALTCPTTPTCPQDDSCTYYSDRASAQVHCAIDYYGGDLQLVQTSTLAGCMRVCAATSKCAAASYVGQNCYMKSILTVGQENESSVGVVIVSREAPAPNPPVTPTTCPAAFTCPENDGCTIRGANSQVLALACGTDYYGGDFASMWADSLPKCVQACADSTNCVAATYTGGKGAGFCYLKDSNNGAGVSENDDSVAIDTRVVPSPSVTYSIASSSTTASSTTTSSQASSTSVAVSSGTSRATSSASSSSSVSSTTSSTLTPTSTPAPVPTQVIVNGDFEATDSIPWSVTGFALLSGPLTGQSLTNPRNGDHSFQAQGESTNNYWLMEMSQVVTVVPGQAYDMSVWSRQAIYGNCDITVNFNDASILGFQPGTSYTEDSVRITADRTTGSLGVLRLSVQCGRGGPQGRLWLDDITMTQVRL